MPNLLLSPLLRWFATLSFPKLFVLTAALFIADAVIPDVIPFVDEILLGLGTLLLAGLRRKTPRDARAAIDSDATRR